MRLRCSGLEDVASYFQWTFKLREGKLHVQKVDDDEEMPSWITIPESFISSSGGDLIDDVISSAYRSLEVRYYDREYLRNRVILAPRNDIVDDVNNRILNRLPSESKTYLSVDRIASTSENFDSHSVLYPVEYLNSLNFSGLRNHQLELKVGMPIILLRNLNQDNGLCNGTRLVITQLADSYRS